LWTTRSALFYSNTLPSHENKRDKFDLQTNFGPDSASRLNLFVCFNTVFLVLKNFCAILLPVRQVFFLSNRCTGIGVLNKQQIHSPDFRMGHRNRNLYKTTHCAKCLNYPTKNTFWPETKYWTKAQKNMICRFLWRLASDSLHVHTKFCRLLTKQFRK
jgi:hypothetical protein